MMLMMRQILFSQCQVQNFLHLHYVHKPKLEVEWDREEGAKDLDLGLFKACGLVGSTTSGCGVVAKLGISLAISI